MIISGVQSTLQEWRIGKVVEETANIPNLLCLGGGANEQEHTANRVEIGP